MRVDVWIPSDNVVVHTASIIKGLAHSRWCLIWLFAGWCILLLFLGISFLFLIVFDHIFIWHPVDCALVILGVPRLCHHHIVYFLLGSSWSWWIIANMVCLVLREFFPFNVCSIKLPNFVELSCHECMRGGAIRNFVFHETVLSFNIYLGSLISSNIYILNWILWHKCWERSKWINSWMGNCTWLETFRSKFRIKSIKISDFTYLLTYPVFWLALRAAPLPTITALILN